MKLRNWLSASTGSQFRRNFLKIARANIIAMALPIALAPLLTRLFMPADYAVLGVFTATVGLLASFATWRLDWMLPNARTIRMSASLAALSLLVLACVCALVAIVLTVLPQRVFDATPLKDIGWIAFLIPIALAAAGMRQTLSGWFVRQADLSAVSKATVLQSVGNSAVSLAAGTANLGSLGLVGATVAANWLGVGTLLRQAGLSFLFALKRVSRRSMRAACAKHGRSATWSTLVAVVNAASLSAPLLVLAHYYQAHEVGWYALMQRLVGAPAGALTSALGQSFWAQAAELARAKQVRELAGLYKKTTRRLLLACIPIAFVCMLGPLYVGRIFGEAEWSGAGYALLAMTPQFLGGMLFSPTNHLVVFDKQHVQLVADGIRLALVVLSIALAAYLEWGFISAVALSSFSFFLGHAVLFAVHLRIHKAYE
ncbi:MAG: lipopolysaccharide biosynthesis protein [Rhizobiaceae bacterium]